MGANRFLRLFDREGSEIWRVAVPEVAWAVNISKDGRLAVAGLGDGTLRWYRMKDGMELLALFAHPDGRRWVVWTPGGYYRASAGGEDLIGWHLNNGADKSPDFFAASRFREQFYRPDVIDHVFKILNGKQVLRLPRGEPRVTPNLQNILPPVISIIAPATDSEQKETKLVVTYRAKSKGSVITSIEAKIDGRPAKVLDHLQDFDHDRQSLTGQITIEIPPENVMISLIAKNTNGASEAAKYLVQWKGPPDFYKPTLYVLAVGVTKYKDQNNNTLEYPAKDARDFLESMKGQEGGLYKKISTRLLTDENATADAILDGLEWLEKETESRDVAMLFLSGHGIRNPANGRYHFLPHDAESLRLNRTTIKGSNIKEFLGAVSGKVILFIDTCHSGDLMPGTKGNTSIQDTDRLANELAEADTGVIVFASSTGKQLSKEDKDWENGAFTKALVEGIKGEADYTKNGFISIGELEVYVSGRVKQLTEKGQKPVTTKPISIEDFNFIRIARRD